MDWEGFREDEKTIDAVVRNLGVLGEAANRLPREYSEKHPEVPWRQITGLRHRIVHDYFGIDLELIWQVVREHLPPLAKRLDCNRS